MAAQGETGWTKVENISSQIWVLSDTWTFKDEIGTNAHKSSSHQHFKLRKFSLNARGCVSRSLHYFEAFLGSKDATGHLFDTAIR